MESAMQRAPTRPSEQCLDALLAVFQPRSPLPLDRDDAAEIRDNLDAFFATLRALRLQRRQGT